MYRLDGKKALLIVLLILSVLYNPRFVKAVDITVTAKVGVSDLWANTIANKSKVTVNQKYFKVGETIRIKFLLGTIGNIKLAHEKITMKVFQNQNLQKTIDSYTNDQNIAEFTFIPDNSDHMRFEFWDNANERDIKINQEVNIAPFQLSDLKTNSEDKVVNRLISFVRSASLTVISFPVLYLFS